MRANKADVNDARVVVNFYYQTIVIAFDIEDHPITWQDVSAGVALLDMVGSYPLQKNFTAFASIED